jgi:TPR repeat protein
MREGDISDAVSYLKLGAAQHNSSAELLSRDCLWEVLGVGGHILFATDSIRGSAAGLNGRGQYELGSALQTGVEVKRNALQAADHLRLSAEQEWHRYCD